VSYGASRVYLLTQLVSQVLPPSSENACSDCAVSGVMPQMKKSHEDGFAVDRFLTDAEARGQSLLLMIVEIVSDPF